MSLASSKSFVSFGRELELELELELGGWRCTLKTMLPDESAKARVPRGSPACFLEPKRSIGMWRSWEAAYAQSEVVSNSIFAN